MRGIRQEKYVYPETLFHKFQIKPGIPPKELPRVIDEGEWETELEEYELRRLERISLEM